MGEEKDTTAAEDEVKEKVDDAAEGEEQPAPAAEPEVAPGKKRKASKARRMHPKKRKGPRFGAETRKEENGEEATGGFGG